jgi:hypothetical protein
MCEGYAVIQKGGRAACIVRWVGAVLMTHSAGSVNTQSIAFKYVINSEPLQMHLIFKTGHDRFAIH